MDDQPRLHCDLHGERALTFACVHIAGTALDRSPPGFVIEPDDDHPLPLAWCLDCEDSLTAEGREWSECWKARAAFKPLCEVCYAELKAQAIGANRFKNLATRG